MNKELNKYSVEELKQAYEKKKQQVNDMESYLDKPFVNSVEQTFFVPKSFAGENLFGFLAKKLKDYYVIQPRTSLDLKQFSGYQSATWEEFRHFINNMLYFVRHENLFK